MTRRIIFVLASFLAAFYLPAWGQDKPAPPHWTYEGEEGPSHWGDLDSSYSACKSGTHQSPIDIRTAQKSRLDPIEFHYQPAPLSITDNGHTIVVNFSAGSSISVGGHSYVLKQFHFHHPSEEEVHGKSFDMVVHLVHADDSGNLAVVAVLLRKGAYNSAINTLWSNFPKEKSVAWKPDGVTFDATTLLPSNRSYYTFSGSLTTPPCSENVTWFVLEKPVTISGAELASFARIYPLNARPTQPLNDRTVRASK